MICDYYCFVKEDFEKIDKRNHLNVQQEYAAGIAVAIWCDIKKQKVENDQGKSIDVAGKKIHICSSIDCFLGCYTLLRANGAYTTETPEDQKKIEHWYQYVDILRAMDVVSVEDLDSQECMYRLNKRYFGKEVFVKTIKKGFSLICSLEELISKGNIKKMCAQHSIDVKDKMIISERIKICEDSLGKREVRFFVEDAQIKNASRYILDGLPHHVAGKFYDKAKEVTERICEGFPGNYVLDLGEYEVDGHKQVDVIEFNPISVSSVYVNNSIFSEKTAQIKACYDEYGFGYEWCLLAMKDKDFIIKERNGMHKYCVDNVLYGI